MERKLIAIAVSSGKISMLEAFTFFHFARGVAEITPLANGNIQKRGMFLFEKGEKGEPDEYYYYQVILNPQKRKVSIKEEMFLDEDTDIFREIDKELKSCL